MSCHSSLRRKPRFPAFLRLLALAALGLLPGCGRQNAGPSAPGFDANTVSLLNLLADPMALPDLRIPSGQLLSSTDITGGNNDWMDASVAGPDGWVTLADLKGPGYVSRFWSTGWSEYTQPIRFYFDNETEPRIALTVNQLFGNQFPFQPPFAKQDNFCYYSNLPIPYAKRLRVQIQAAKPGGKFYFQLNYTTLPEGSRVASFPTAWSEEEKAAWKRTAAAMEAGGPPEPQGLVSERRSAKLAAGATLVLESLKGPGILRDFRCTPKLEGTGSGARGQALLRQANLQVHWDDQAFPSVELPLGDFFGQNLRLTAYKSLAHSFDGTTFSCRLPMPFKKASITLVNTGEQAFELDFEFRIQPMTELPAHLGYLHAGWQGSWPEDIGPPHAALRVKGDGKYIGGLLSVDSAATGSWWGLEGDEFIRMDDAFMPQWKGTGIEDHYNGGWYYRVPLAEMLTGLLLRIPYHAVQYRWHLLDAPRFHQSMDLHFERGGENEAPLLMETAAWYYLTSPQQADTDIPPYTANRIKNPAANEKALAHHLAELERLGDYSGCRRLLQSYLDDNPTPSPTTERMRLRDLLYRERMEGSASVDAALVEFQKNAAQTNSIRQLADRSWLHASPSNALLQVASPIPVDVWYEGRNVGVAGPGLGSFRVRVPTAPTVVAVRSTQDAPNTYLHVLLTAQDRQWLSDDTWRYRENPSAGWEKVDYDLAEWNSHIGKWLRLAIPPETVDTPLDLLSKAENLIRPFTKTPKELVYRKVWTPADSTPLR